MNAETQSTAVAQRMEHDAPTRLYDNGPMTPMDMIDRALTAGQGPEVLKQLMDLQERWEANQGRKAFDAAIAQAKAEMPVIVKSRTVDFTTQKGRTHYQHEDLAGIARQIDPILSKHGLSYRFRSAQGEGGLLTVTCIISHRDGYSEETSLSAGRDESGNKNNIQAVGSTLTYLQRYTLKAALGLAASADDDGRASEAPETVSAEQVQTLRRALTAAKSDAGKFCDYFGIEAIDDLPAAKFDAALKMIEAAKRKREKAAPAQAEGASS
jgi:hypothetical protein